jgi:hypothetical protein
MINHPTILDYADKAVMGLVSMKADSGKVTLTVRRFSPEDGHELSPQDIDASLESLTITIGVLEKRLANLKALRAMIK